MSDALRLVRLIEEAGGAIRAKDGQIEIWAPEGVVTPEVRDHLKALKQDLLKLVRWTVRRLEIPSQTQPGCVDVWMTARNDNKPDQWRFWFVETRPGGVRTCDSDGPEDPSKECAE